MTFDLHATAGALAFLAAVLIPATAVIIGLVSEHVHARWLREVRRELPAIREEFPKWEVVCGISGLIMKRTVPGGTRWRRSVAVEIHYHDKVLSVICNEYPHAPPRTLDTVGEALREIRAVVQYIEEPVVEETPTTRAILWTLQEDLAMFEWKLDGTAVFGTFASADYWQVSVTRQSALVVRTHRGETLPHRHITFGEEELLTDALARAVSHIRADIETSQTTVPDLISLLESA